MGGFFPAPVEQPSDWFLRRDSLPMLHLSWYDERSVAKHASAFSNRGTEYAWFGPSAIRKHTETVESECLN